MNNRYAWENVRHKAKDCTLQLCKWHYFPHCLKTLTAVNYNTGVEGYGFFPLNNDSMFKCTFLSSFLEWTHF